MNSPALTFFFDWPLILFLTANTAPANPFHRGPLYFPDFYFSLSPLFSCPTYLSFSLSLSLSISLSLSLSLYLSLMSLKVMHRWFGFMNLSNLILTEFILGVPKKLSFGSFNISKLLRIKIFSTLEITDKKPSLTKFWTYLDNVKIDKIRHLIGHISYINQNLKKTFCKKKHPDVVAHVPSF